MSVQAARRGTVAANRRKSSTGGTVVFSDDFSSGDFTNWQSCQWNAGGTIRNDDCQSYNGTSQYPATVTNGGTGHEQAARFEQRNGDIPFGSGERTEIGEPPADVVEGDIRRVEWDMMFPTGFPTPTGGWFIVQQWHGIRSGSSPPLAINIEPDDNVYIENQDWEFGAPNLYQTVIQPVQRNVWQHWRYDVKFSPNPAVGWIQVWVDGVEEVPLTSRAHMLIGGGESNYFKTGIYRDPSNTATAIVWIDNLVITDIG